MSRRDAVTEARTLLEAERYDAWKAYLSATRGVETHRYEEVEPWAWKALQRRLDKVERHEAALNRYAPASEKTA